MSQFQELQEMVREWQMPDTNRASQRELTRRLRRTQKLAGALRTDLAPKVRAARQRAKVVPRPVEWKSQPCRECGNLMALHPAPNYYPCPVVAVIEGVGSVVVA